MNFFTSAKEMFISSLLPVVILDYRDFASSLFLPEITITGSKRGQTLPALIYLNGQQFSKRI